MFRALRLFQILRRDQRHPILDRDEGNINARGQRADFHSVRYTLATNLALAGTPPRVAMEIMRHSDMRLRDS
jgi:hypothetical protein